MANKHKKNSENKLSREDNFVGRRPQFFKHKDDKEEIRKRRKKEVEEYIKGKVED